MRKIDLKGQKFGKLEVIEQSKNHGRKVAWSCKCDCGKIIEVTSTHLISGHTKSCGCIYFRHFQTEGGKATRLYRIWIAMRKRCDNEKDIGYSYYGGRGIRVCDEWENDFVNFQTWSLSNGYAENLTIDRIDTNGNYCPENCRWSTKKEQATNRRSNKYLVIDGVKKTYTEWSLLIGRNRSYFTSYMQRHTENEAIAKIKGVLQDENKRLCI